MVSKDEALKIAIDYLDGSYEAHKVRKACQEALEQPVCRKCGKPTQKGECFYGCRQEQPAQAITEGSQLSNIKAGSQSEKPSSPPAPKHTCTYSRTMNQEYPRKCIHCGEVESLAQPAQEPVAIVYSMQDGYIGQMVVKDIPHKTKLYTHPAPSWQGLTAKEIASIPLNEYTVQTVERILKEKNHV